MKLCTSEACRRVQRTGDVCGKCGAKTTEVPAALEVRFDKNLRLATRLDQLAASFSRLRRRDDLALLIARVNP